MRTGLLVWYGTRRRPFWWARRVLGLPDVDDAWWVLGDGFMLGPYYGTRHVAEAAALEQGVTVAGRP